MRSDTVPAGRVRLVITLSVVSAVMVLAGGILVVATTATHLIGRRSGGHVTSLGVALGVAGLAVGLVTLVLFAFARSRRGRKGRRARAAAGPLVTGDVRRRPRGRAVSGDGC